MKKILVALSLLTMLFWIPTPASAQVTGGVDVNATFQPGAPVTLSGPHTTSLSGYVGYSFKEYYTVFGEAIGLKVFPTTGQNFDFLNLNANVSVHSSNWNGIQPYLTAGYGSYTTFVPTLPSFTNPATNIGGGATFRYNWFGVNADYRHYIVDNSGVFSHVNRISTGVGVYWN